MAQNEEQGLINFEPNHNFETRKVLNKDGEPVALIGDIDEWSCLYQKQDDLEKLRLYFTMLAWSLISKVYPKHDMLNEFQNIIVSGEFMRQKLKKFAEDIDEISVSMNALGKIPDYHLLTDNQTPQVIIKSEPADK